MSMISINIDNIKPNTVTFTNFNEYILQIVDDDIVEMKFVTLLNKKIIQYLIFYNTMVCMKYFHLYSSKIAKDINQLINNNPWSVPTQHGEVVYYFTLFQTM
jgi:hypothetical protein